MVTRVARKPKVVVEEQEPEPETQDGEAVVSDEVVSEEREEPLPVVEGPGEFTFVGDPLDDLSGPVEFDFHARGEGGALKRLRFIKNEPRDVKDPLVAAKLRRHSHFVEGDGKVVVKRQTVKIEKLRSECLDRDIKFGRHDGVSELKRLLGRR